MCFPNLLFNKQEKGGGANKCQSVAFSRKNKQKQRATYMSPVTVESDGCTMVTDILLAAGSFKYKKQVRDSNSLQVPDVPH